MGRQQGYSPEFRAEAVREVVEKKRSMADVARSLNLVPQTLGNWVNAFYKSRDADGTELSVAERARIRELERRVSELEEENEFLGKACAFFAKKPR
jgi:transposase